jgi:hypothetical protein
LLKDYRMNVTAQMAKHLRDVYFGGNWTTSNLKENLSDINWEQATKQVYSFNTIATLVYHVNYFVLVAINVLEGGPLEGNDKESFDHPPILSQEDWRGFLDEMWADAERFAGLIEQLPESKLSEDFTDKKYGTYYRNICGITEHIHYHLGQIVLIKQILSQEKANRI